MASLLLGLLVPEVLATPESVDLAASVEDAGLDAAWFTEVEREPFARCAAVASRTSRLRIGTAIAQWSRGPVTMAATGAELDELSQGRFMLGVGTGTAHQNLTVHQIDFARPARRMREYLEIIKGAWGADIEPLDYAGDHFTVQGYAHSLSVGRPPLLLAAVGDVMLRLAASRADGVILNPSTTPWFVRRHVEAQLIAGAARSGRRLSDFHRVSCVRASVDADRAAARQRARHGIAEYAAYPVHQAQYAQYGYGAEAQAISQAVAAGDIRSAVAAVSDDMVDALSVAGTPDEVRSAVRRWEGLVDSLAFTSPAYGVPVDEVRANCFAIIEAFSS